MRWDFSTEMKETNKVYRCQLLNHGVYLVFHMTVVQNINIKIEQPK